MSYLLFFTGAYKHTVDVLAHAFRNTITPFFSTLGRRMRRRRKRMRRRKVTMRGRKRMRRRRRREMLKIRIKYF